MIKPKWIKTFAATTEFGLPKEVGSKKKTEHISLLIDDKDYRVTREMGVMMAEYILSCNNKIDQRRIKKDKALHYKETENLSIRGEH